MFTGSFEALTFDDRGAVPLETRTAYLLPAEGRARTFLRRLFPRPGRDGFSAHRMVILDTEVTFTLDDPANLLLIDLPGDGGLPVTMPENWLGDPLRILFGQLIYPRFVARGIRDRRMNWIRPSPPWSTETGACGLWQTATSTIGRANSGTAMHGCWPISRKRATMRPMRLPTSMSRSFRRPADRDGSGP